ncbi:hypothetical protein [Gordonia sp. NPDC003422]
MRVTGADLVDLSGELTEITLTWTDSPTSVGSPVSFNQANHLAAHAAATSNPVWIAGTVELGDSAGPPPNPQHIADVVRQVVAEQEALRLRFSWTPEPRQHVLDPTHLRTGLVTHGQADTADIVALINSRCHPQVSPGICFALVGRTLLCAFDHAHADALTVDIILRRLHLLSTNTSAQAAAPPGFVGRCVADAADVDRFRTPDGCDDTETIERLAGWRNFFTETGGRVPTFPLPLGDVPANTPQRTLVRTVLSADDAGAIDAGLFATVLADLASVIDDLGGPSRLAALIPLHTRGQRDSGWHDTAGWMVTNAPVLVDAGDRAGARSSLRAAIDLARVPLPIVLERCAPQLPSGDIFMISYLDYRKLGPRLPGAQHISACSTADDVQIWFSRSEDGLDVRVRHPATPGATGVVDAVIERLTDRLRARAVDTSTAVAAG